MKKKLIAMLLSVFVLTLFLGVGMSLDTNPAAALDIHHNNPHSEDGARIRDWEKLRGMTTYGPNGDGGCGMTAMTVLLQFYNDNSCYHGQILPDEFNYVLNNKGLVEIGGVTTSAQSRANALRADLFNRAR